MKEFYGSIHNHTDRSNFRLRDSTNRLEELCWYAAKDLGHNFIAITDHETISTAINCQKVEKSIRQEFPNFKIIRGNEIYLCRNGLNKENYVRGEDKFFHWVLLAKDEIGHRQIREISTKAWGRCFMQGKMLRVPTYYQDLIDVIGENKGHVIMSTACLGSYPSQMLLKYNDTKDEELWQYILAWFNRIIEICGKENLYLETQPSYNREQIVVNLLYKKLSEELNIPVVISLDAHYLKQEDEPIHHAFLTSQEGDRETHDFYASTYMMSREEIHKYMDNSLSEETVTEWMNNTQRIYNECKDYDLTKPLHIPYLPKTIDTITNEEYLYFKDKVKELSYFYESDIKPHRDMAAAIVRKMIKEPETYDNEKAYAAIDECLTAIRLASEKQNTPWSAYLLNMRDYINVIWEKGNSLVGPSRGSGGGFLLLNMLDITQMNPLKEKAPLRAWRFLNPERVSPLDIDTDIEGGKRAQVYEALQKEYGYDRVSKVLTIRTEKSKSAILTAARGLGLDPDEGAYLASFIKSDRGQQRTLSQTYYGDEENDMAPDMKFRELMDNKYPKLWEVARYIEGLCCGVGSHAGGVIFYDEPITNSTALMQTTNGDVVTQYDLHVDEEVGLIKIDLLSIEALDRIRACIDLLTQYGYLDKNKTLKEKYEEAVGIYNIERDEKKMWQMLHEHKVQALFQMEQQSGIKGIALTKPTSVEELAAINAVMRLMPPEKGMEQPIDTFANRKKNPHIWEEEMIRFGLNKEEREWLHGWLDTSYGICETQETLMSMLQDEKIGGHTLLFADRVRKAVAKKKPKEFLECQEEFYKTAEEKGLSDRLVHYTWDIIFASSRGYSFCMAHTLAYSLVGLQELNLAYKYPIVFWDTANLIVDSGAMNLEEEFNFEEEDEDEDNDEENEEEGKIKNSSTDYGRIAAAIGKMKSRGLSFSLPDINKSAITFSPDLEKNTIIYGLKGIARIGNQLIKDIILNRPYHSIEDFINKIKVNKIQMTNLIKSGVFDEIYPDKNRVEIMEIYLDAITDKKKRITLQNMASLIKYNLIPEYLDFEKRLYNFNKYIKKFKEDKYYRLDTTAMNFFEQNYDTGVLEKIVVTGEEKTALIPQNIWDNTYKKGMNPMRDWMKKEQENILSNLNNILIEENKNKYASGSISKWEMDSLSFYYHDHELSNLKNEVYDIVDYFSIPEEPEIDSVFKGKDDATITLFKLNRIAGTVIDKDKNKNTVTLLTPTGVVVVKVWKSQFSAWDKQISEKDSDGKKHVVEKSWFTRGNKLIITGIKRDDTFIPKKYKGTEWPLFEKIEEIDDKGFILSSSTERVEVE